MAHSSAGTADTALRRFEGSPTRDIADCGNSEALIGATSDFSEREVERGRLGIYSETGSPPPCSAMDENEHFGMRGLCPRKSGQFWTKPNGIPRQIRATASYTGRKVWIIINQIKPEAPLSYSGVNEERFPAPISSAEGQELCAWIERVQIA